MEMSALITYRMSDYPNRPSILISAPLPIDMEELRAYIRLLRDKIYATQQPSFSVHAQHPDTHELSKIAEFDFATPEDDIDFSAFA